MQKTILIVEDDADLRISLRKILTVHNFKVLEAADGAEALERVEKERPDLVLLDFGLPLVSGETVCVKIKETYPEIIVIALTEKSSKSEVVHGLQIGADDYIAKPFVIEELIARIDARLKNHKQINSQEEQKILIMRESTVLIALKIITMEFIFGILTVIISLASSFFYKYFQLTETLSLNFFVMLLLLLLNLVLIIFIILKWQAEYAEITKDNITKHSGIFSKKEQKYACNFVEIITLEQSILGTIFNYGTIELYDPALKEQIYLMNVANPKRQRKVIEERVAKSRNQDMPFVT